MALQLEATTTTIRRSSLPHPQMTSPRQTLHPTVRQGSGGVYRPLRARRTGCNQIPLNPSQPPSPVWERGGGDECEPVSDSMSVCLHVCVYEDIYARHRQCGGHVDVKFSLWLRRRDYRSNRRANKGRHVRLKLATHRWGTRLRYTLIHRVAYVSQLFIRGYISSTPWSKHRPQRSHVWVLTTCFSSFKVTLSTDRMSRRRERCVSRVPNRWLPLLISIPSHPA